MGLPDEDVYFILEHGNLGQIKGTVKSEVVQYLNVQYATLEDRFSSATPVDGRRSETTPGIYEPIDATTLGPIVLNPPKSCESEQALFQKAIPFKTLRQSDTESLTVNINTPIWTQSKGLPVLVFLHGGGFVSGSCCYPQYDLARIVNLSIKAEMPMVCVGIKVGVPGFLHSSTMAHALYRPNNGLHDQRVALIWIQNNITGFGGDPARVTLMGESAGAGEPHCHLQSDFRDVVLMSGSSLLRPRPTELLDQNFQAAAELLGAGAAEANQRLHVLLKEPIDQFSAKIGRQISVGPIVDGNVIPRLTSFQDLENEEDLRKLFPSVSHCKRMLVGSCQFDGMIFGRQLASRKDFLPKTLTRCLSRVLDEDSAGVTQSLVAAYNLNGPAASIENVLRFGGDVMYLTPALSFARAWSASVTRETKSFHYRFECPNPWPGPWEGHATHGLDIAFALQNYNDHLATGQRICAERFGRDLITFVHGDDPWPSNPIHGECKSMVYYASSNGQEDASGITSERAPSSTDRRDISQSILLRERHDRRKTQSLGHPEMIPPLKYVQPERRVFVTSASLPLGGRNTVRMDHQWTISVFGKAPMESEPGSHVQAHSDIELEDKELQN